MNELYQLNEEYYYVYEQWLDGRVIYVGKGKKNRALDLQRNEFWKDAVKDNFFNIDIVINAYFKKEKDAFDYEKKLIRRHLRDGQPLTNLEYGNIDFLSKSKKETKKEEISIKILNKIDFYNNLEVDEFVKKTIKRNKKVVIFSRGVNKSNKRELKKIENVKILELYAQKGKRKYGKNNVLKNGIIPEKYNVIFFPIEILSLSTMKIKDESVKSVIINDKFIDENIALQKISTNLEFLYVKKDIKETPKKEFDHDIVEKYLNKLLTAEDKKELCEELSVINERGFYKKWVSIKKILFESGYTMQEKVVRIEGKQVRTSIINKSKENIDKSC